MEPKEAQEISERDQLWASLRALRPEIDRLAAMASAHKMTIRDRNPPTTSVPLGSSTCANKMARCMATSSFIVTGKPSGSASSGQYHANEVPIRDRRRERLRVNTPHPGRPA